jgi:putative aldouronate transport system substrate-binding protein
MKARKITVVVMMAVLTFSMLLSACSTNNATNPGASQSPESSAATEPTPADDSGKPADPLGKYETPIELTAVRNYNQGTKFIAGDNENDNTWTRAYEEELGIKLKYDWVTTGTSDQYNQKLNLSISSGDLPDTFSVDAKTLKQLVEADQLEDLTEAFNKYASPLLKEAIAEYGDSGLGSSTVNGKLMALPVTGSGDYSGSEVLWVRKDWLDKLNLPEPKTWDDVLAIATAFTEQDPDGNQKKDTYGIPISKDINGYPDLQGFFNAYQGNPSNVAWKQYMWIKDPAGDGLAYGSIQPEVKTALTKLQELYKAGIVDPEFGVKDTAKALEGITGGKAGLYFGYGWAMNWPLGEAVQKDPTANWVAYPIPTANGEPLKLSYYFPLSQWFVVKKGYANPEAVIKMANLYLEKLAPQKVTVESNYKYGKSQDGIEIINTALINSSFVTANMNTAAEVRSAVLAKDPSQLKAEQKVSYDEILKYMETQDPKYWVQYSFMKTMEVVEGYIAGDNYRDSLYGGPPTQTMVEKQAILDKLELETFTKIIMGAVSPDEFDKFVSQWKQLGGDQITAEVNEWYASAK